MRRYMSSAFQTTLANVKAPSLMLQAKQNKTMENIVRLANAHIKNSCGTLDIDFKFITNPILQRNGCKHRATSPTQTI